MSNRPLSNSMGALRWLYTVAAGFAVVTAVRTFALDANEKVDFQFDGDLLALVVFMSIVIRFSHGAIRHFHKYYDETTSGWRPLRPLTDFFGLFFEAFFFLLMALALEDHPQFALLYILLLAVDTAWVSTIPVSEPPYRNWLIANSLFFLFTIPFFVWKREQDAVLLPVLGTMTLVHHVLDYVSPGNWHYYFDGVPRPRLLVWIEERHGESFLKAGNCLWAILAILRWIWRFITPKPIRKGLAWCIEPVEETPPTSLRGVIFIAGKYNAPSWEEIDQNIGAAEEAAVALWNAGFGVFTPHLNTAHFEAKATRSEDAYTDFDLHMLRCVDAVLALPGWEQSSGARAEIEEAERLSKPVFHSVEDITVTLPGTHP